MTVSKRVQTSRNDKFHGHRRGHPQRPVTEKTRFPVGPVVLGFFIFVVVGSALLQTLRTTTGGGF